MRAAAPFVALAIASVATPAFGATYEVGPGRALASISDVPWEALGPGDLVLIHWRAAPYTERWVIGRRGTMAAPIVVRGVRGPGGERPVIDGRDATARRQLDWWNEDRGVIKIGGSNVPADTTPAWIVVEGLEVRSARPPFRYTTAMGPADWRDDAASIYVEKGEHITLRDNAFIDSANGLFVAWQTSDLLVEANDISGNGVDGSIFVHNSYTEANGAVFQYNHYGPLRMGCPGNALKDRSAGLVVRYNWIEGGNRQLDLVESDELYRDPKYRLTQVYGNLLLEPGDDGNSQIVHYGGDGADQSRYRKGTLHFHHNTVISRRTRSTTLFRVSTNDERVQAANNVVWVSVSGGLGIVDSTGMVDLSSNWLRRGWVETHGTLMGTISQSTPQLTGTMPDVLDLPGDDFRPAPGGNLIDAAGPLSPAAELPFRQYVRHLRSEARPVEMRADLGAWELVVAPPDAGVAADAAAMDAGAPPPDAAAPATDAATAPIDAGTTPADAGTTPSDAGTTPADAGATAAADAAASAGADAADTPTSAEEGCGCATTATRTGAPPFVTLALALALALPAARRRRR